MTSHLSSRITRGQFLALVAMGIGVTACGGTAARPAAPSVAAVAATSTSFPSSPTTSAAAIDTSQPSVLVHVGLGGTLGEAGVGLAITSGYFARYGLSVDVVQNNQDQLPELLTGALDVAATPVNPGFFNAAARNVGLKVIAPLARQDANASGLWMVIRKDLADAGKVSTYADLRGLKIAAPNQALEYVVDKALVTANLKLTDVDFQRLDFPAIVAAFGNKAIDVAMVPEPIATATAQKGLISKWKRAGEITPGNQQTVLMASAQFLAKRDAVNNFVTAYLLGVRDYNDAFLKELHRQQTIDQLIKTQAVKDPAVYAVMAYAAIDPNGHVNVDSLDQQMRWYVHMSYLKAPVDASTLVDSSFVTEAVAKLGVYK